MMTSLLLLLIRDIIQSVSIFVFPFLFVPLVLDSIGQHEHETEMSPQPPPSPSHVICRFSVARRSCTWICNNFTASMVLMSAVKSDRGAFLCLCVRVCMCVIWNTLSCGVSSSGSSLAADSSQGSFFFSFFPPSVPVLSISVCLGIRAGVYPLHTHTSRVPHLLLSQDSGSGFACSRSQLSGKLSLLSFTFFRSF